MISKPEIIIVDDHLTFRRGLISILTIEDIATVIGEASDGGEFLELLSHLTPDLVLMDIDMPKMNGIKATEKALELMPDLKIIAYTMYGEEEYYSKMKDLGIYGFLLKSSGIYELEKAINDVIKGKKYFKKEPFIKSLNKHALDKNENHS
jgi:DNA-binding NarL/FixJ family response regulator